MSVRQVVFLYILCCVMGGDGGVFAVNRKFFAACKNTSKDGQAESHESEERQIKLSKRFVKCRTCAISNEQLQEPVVVCRLGYLYSKENLIKCLLEKTLHSNFSHIKGLKHVKDAILTPNPEYSVDSGGDTSLGKEESELQARYMCPVTQLPLNGLYNFIVIWTTGYVLSEKAIREIGHDGLQLEYGPFSSDDIVGLLPPEDELNTRRATLEAQTEIAKKKAKEERKRSRELSKSNQKDTGEASERPSKTSKSIGQKSSSNTLADKPAKCTKINAGASIVDAANNSVVETKTKSKVYDKLFHKEKTDEKKSGNDLFFSVAGIRYTL